MQNPVGPTLVAVALVVMVGCGSSSDSAATSSSQPTTSRPPTPAEAEGQIKASNSAACQTNYDTLHTAIETYSAINGADPASVSDLVPDILREEPMEWTLTAGPAGKATIEVTPAGRKAGCVMPEAGS